MALSGMTGLSATTLMEESFSPIQSAMLKVAREEAATVKTLVPGASPSIIQVTLQVATVVLGFWMSRKHSKP